MISCVSPNGFRLDGRYLDNFRHLDAEFGDSYSGPDGSCVLTQGCTKVKAEVIGPSDLDNSKRQVQVTYSTGRGQRETKWSDIGDLNYREKAATIERVITEVMSTTTTKSQIYVNITVLETFGSEEAVALNATMLALVHAGVPLKDMPVALTVGIIDNEELVDLTNDEENKASHVLLIFNSSQKTLLHLSFLGKLNPQQIGACMEKGANILPELVKSFGELIKSYVLSRYSKAQIGGD